MNITLNIHKFAKTFSEIYHDLYVRHDNEPDFDFMVDEFDRRMKNSPSFNAFVCEFVKYRQDLITSDREAAAFMYTLAIECEA